MGPFGVGVGDGVLDGVKVAVGVDVLVEVGVGVSVEVGVLVGVADAVADGDGVNVFVGPAGVFVTRRSAVGWGVLVTKICPWTAAGSITTAPTKNNMGIKKPAIRRIISSVRLLDKTTQKYTLIMSCCKGVSN